MRRPALHQFWQRGVLVNDIDFNSANGDASRKNQICFADSDGIVLVRGGHGHGHGASYAAPAVTAIITVGTEARGHHYGWYQGRTSRTFITCVKAASKTRRPYLSYMLFDERDQSRHSLCAATELGSLPHLARCGQPRQVLCHLFSAAFEDFPWRLRRRTRCLFSPN